MKKLLIVPALYAGYAAAIFVTPQGSSNSHCGILRTAVRRAGLSALQLSLNAFFAYGDLCKKIKNGKILIHENLKTYRNHSIDLAYVGKNWDKQNFAKVSYGVGFACAVQIVRGASPTPYAGEEFGYKQYMPCGKTTVLQRAFRIYRQTDAKNGNF